MSRKRNIHCLNGNENIKSIEPLSNPQHQQSITNIAMEAVEVHYTGNTINNNTVEERAVAMNMAKITAGAPGNCIHLRWLYVHIIRRLLNASRT